MFSSAMHMRRFLLLAARAARHVTGEGSRAALSTWARELATAPSPATAKRGRGVSAVKPRIDFNAVVANIDKVEENALQRGCDRARPRLVASLYEESRKTRTSLQNLRTTRNAVAKAVQSCKSDDEREALVKQGKTLKAQITAYEEELRALQARLDSEAVHIPNSTHPDAPLENPHVLHEHGTKPSFSFTPRDHVDILESLNMLDLEAGSDVAGPKFAYCKGDLVLLEVALQQLCLSRARTAGFTLVSTPDIVKRAVVDGCGFHPRDDQHSQIYSLSAEAVDAQHAVSVAKAARSDTAQQEREHLCLSGTAEIPLAGMHMDQILEENALPLRLAAVGRCFRTEAGAGGRDSRGLFRVHQFSKVELFSFCAAKDSDTVMWELVDFQKRLYADLGLHYQVIDMPPHDLGHPAYRKIDIEAWMPGRGAYGEVSSTSNCTDFQARRLNIRHRPGNEFVHTVNGTGIAVSRMIVALTETHQREDGSVDIPEVLHPFLPGVTALTRAP